MDRDRARPDAPAGASFHAPLQPARTLVVILIPVLLVASVTLVRAAGSLSRPATTPIGAVDTLTPAELAEAAADALELVTASGGPGYTFGITQHGTLVAKPGGELIELPDPDDPSEMLTVDSHAVGSYLERGSVTPAGFHAEIRRGPDDPSARPDWDGSPLELAALVRDGRTFRNDGQGWYATDRPPGIGLDPATAGLLPRMLRQLTPLADAAEPEPSGPLPLRSAEPGRSQDDQFVDIAPARRLEGGTTVADIPGVIAVDLAAATELRGPAELAFDDEGRLVGLRILARNTHLHRYDLMVETVITFAYPETRHSSRSPSRLSRVNFVGHFLPGIGVARWGPRGSG